MITVFGYYKALLLPNASSQLGQKETLGTENKNTPTRIETLLEYLRLFLTQGSWNQQKKN